MYTSGTAFKVNVSPITIVLSMLLKDRKDRKLLLGRKAFFSPCHALAIYLMLGSPVLQMPQEV